MTQQSTFAFCALTFALACALPACGRPTAQTPATDQAQAPQAHPPLTGDQLHRIGQMHHGYTSLITARDAYVSGDANAARLELTNVAMQPMPEGVAPIWAPNVLTLHQMAAKGAQAELSEGVAEGIGMSANACGSCHQATGYIPNLAMMPEPPTGDDASAQMLRHAFAAQELWDGLITHDITRWQRGSAILEHTRVTPELLFGQGYYARMGARQVDALIQATTVLREATEWEPRATAYGELLTTCASCHGTPSR